MRKHAPRDFSVKGEHMVKASRGDPRRARQHSESIEVMLALRKCYEMREFTCQCNHASALSVAKSSCDEEPSNFEKAFMERENS